MATMKVLVYLGSEDAAAYKVQVFGDSGNYEGSYDKMKEIYGSPEITTTVTEVF
jgi:hypothetical protein